MALIVTADQEAGINALEINLEEAFTNGTVNQALAPVLDSMPMYDDENVQAVKPDVKNPFKSLIAAAMLALNIKGPFPTGLSVTVPLAKLTPGGLNGSLTFVNGLLTAKVDPT